MYIGVYEFCLIVNLGLTDIFSLQSLLNFYHMYANDCPTKCNYMQFIYICKPLRMFRVLYLPIMNVTGRELQFPSSHVHDRLQLRFY